jgi:hypothetical protein
MGQHHALGPPRGPAGIGQHDNVGLEVHGRLRLQRLAHHVLQRQAFLRPDDDDILDAGPLRRRARGLHEGGDRHQKRRVRIDKLMMDLGRGIGRVDRGHRAAAPGHGVKHDGVFRHVRREDRHRAAGQDAAFREPAGQPLDPLHQGTGGQRAARGPVGDGGLVLPAHQPLEQLLGDRDSIHLDRAVAARVSRHWQSSPRGRHRLRRISRMRGRLTRADRQMSSTNRPLHPGRQTPGEARTGLGRSPNHREITPSLRIVRRNLVSTRPNGLELVRYADKPAGCPGSLLAVSENHLAITSSSQRCQYLEIGRSGDARLFRSELGVRYP